MKEIIVEQNDAGQRLDRFLKKYLDKSPNSFIYKMIRKKNIKVNNKKCEIHYILQLNDCIQLYLSDETIDKYSQVTNYQPSDTDLDVVYEDQDIVVINKPIGILVQPDHTQQVSLWDVLLQRTNYNQSVTFRPAFCNRLDKNTSGLIIAGKTAVGLQGMNKAIRDKNVTKIYYAIVEGHVKKEQHLYGFIERDSRIRVSTVTDNQKQGQKPIETIIRPTQHGKDYTEIQIQLVTGKTHQIRAHLANIGHPLIGDIKYGSHVKNHTHFFLHAYSLEFKNMPQPLEHLNEKKIVASFPQHYIKLKETLFRN